ncbi:AMP-binding protein [Streptomyces nogalater]
MTDDPARPVRGLPLLTDAERTELLVTRNATPAEGPAPLSERFEAQADRTPDAVAAVSPSTTLSYAELDARANRLAHHLAERGVGRGSVVAVVLPRTPTCSWPCWPSSRPEPPTCRSTTPTPPAASASW